MAPFAASALVPPETADVIWSRSSGAKHLPAVTAAATKTSEREQTLSQDGPRYTPEQAERLRSIHARVIEARRELDALIGDAYLRPRASIVPVHFLDLAAAAEKLRWAEKEWRELDKQLSGETTGSDVEADDDAPVIEEDEEAELAVDLAHTR